MMVEGSPNHLQNKAARRGDVGQGAIQVVSRPLEEIQPDPRNPRLHAPKQVRQIVRSIETFGFNVPILIDKEGRIIAGHGRYQAAHMLGWVSVPTIRGARGIGVHR